MAILLGGPSASRIVSPIRHWGRLFTSTVGLPSITTPGPWTGSGGNVAHRWMSAPDADMALCAAAVMDALRVCSAGKAAPALDAVAASAVATAASAAALAVASAAAMAAGMPRHAGRLPISTLKLPGPG